MSDHGSRRQLFYLVLDGLGDVPCPTLEGRTPLEAARLPHFDRLAGEGTAYRLDMVDSYGRASTASGQFALLGYDDDEVLPRRGAVEGAGIGMPLQDGDVALRANWATLDERGWIVDRRAGRIREGTDELAAAINEMDLGDGVTALVGSGTEHRVALLLRGPGLAAGLTNSDPQRTSDEPLEPLVVAPRIAGDQPAAHTAAKLRSFLHRIGPLLADHPVNQQRRAAGLLPANGLVIRQAGRHRALPTLEERFGLRCRAIVGDSTVTGVMRLIGCETFTQPGFTANADTDLEGKLAAAQAGLAAGHDVVLLHVKALDILSHDRLPKRSVALLERLDALMGSWMTRPANELLLAIGADHSTSSVSGDHIKAPTPALIHGAGVPPSGIAAFHEGVLAEAGAPVLQRSAFFRQVVEALGR